MAGGRTINVENTLVCWRERANEQESFSLFQCGELQLMTESNNYTTHSSNGDGHKISTEANKKQKKKEWKTRGVREFEGEEKKEVERYRDAVKANLCIRISFLPWNKQGWWKDFFSLAAAAAALVVFPASDRLTNGTAKVPRNSREDAFSVFFWYYFFAHSNEKERERELSSSLHGIWLNMAKAWHGRHRPELERSSHIY